MGYYCRFHKEFPEYISLVSNNIEAALAEKTKLIQLFPEISVFFLYLTFIGKELPHLFFHIKGYFIINYIEYSPNPVHA